MNKRASTFVQAFVELPPPEQAKVIDLIAEYYLANPRSRQALLRKAAASEVVHPDTTLPVSRAAARGND